ncbi:hypothetical protein evm_010070 [Chilo suppressalis]|nr:hypothetical protein evm_010070 [Chilo suppressalis]
MGGDGFAYEDSPSILQDAQGHPLLPNDPNTIDMANPTASHHQSPIAVWLTSWSRTSRENDKKSAVKKITHRNAARRRTGGGVENVPELTELEEPILILMGGDDSHLRIELFSHLHQKTAHQFYKMHRGTRFSQMYMILTLLI